jgi:hypothetical protein
VVRGLTDPASRAPRRLSPQHRGCNQKPNWPNVFPLSRMSLVVDSTTSKLSFSPAQVSLDDPSDRRILELLALDATDSEVQAMATVLARSIDHAAERLVWLH